MVDEIYAHRPVMLEEVMEALNILPAGIYIDATFGRGGHADALLQRLGPNGRLLAFDKDPEAIKAAEMFGADPRFSIAPGSFSQLTDLCAHQGLMGCVNGVLFDLGVSSPQLDDPARGFSFRHDGPLDMRMDPSQGIAVAAWLAQADEQEIEHVIRDYGEERFARRIARAIVHGRVERPIVTTLQLAELVAAAVPRREPGKDPATRTFQALRIFINRELDDLQEGLEQVLDVLAVGGRLVVISFHSLEDRIVKRFIRTHCQGPQLPRRLPVMPAGFEPRLRRIGKARSATTVEIKQNPRARSAYLRVAEKIH